MVRGQKGLALEAQSTDVRSSTTIWNHDLCTAIEYYKETSSSSTLSRDSTVHTLVNANYAKGFHENSVLGKNKGTTLTDAAQNWPLIFPCTACCQKLDNT